MRLYYIIPISSPLAMILAGALLLCTATARAAFGCGYAALWGSQSWLQPAFSRLREHANILKAAQQGRLKGGCGQDCPPHNQWHVEHQAAGKLIK